MAVGRQEGGWGREVYSYFSNLTLHVAHFRKENQVFHPPRSSSVCVFILEAAATWRVSSAGKG